MLHLRYTWSWFDKKWAPRPEWITAAKQRVLQLWTPYSTLPVDDSEREDTSPQRVETSTMLWDSDDDEAEQPIRLTDEYDLVPARETKGHLPTA